jgi:blue copper oxidase
MKFSISFILICLSTLINAQNPLIIPDTLSGSNINLSLQNGSVNFFPGNATNTMGVNGNILGPTLLLNKHQQVTINVTNNLGEASTIHWHGMHVSPENDGGPHIVINDGQTWSPNFEVLDWSATYWYHPHLHHKTNEHVLKGIAGFVIVRDSTEAQINLPRKYGIDDFPLAIQSKAFTTTNQIEIMSALDTTILVNGTQNPFLNAPAQVVRLRLLNGSSERYYNFGFTGNKSFTQIASDGGLLPNPVNLTRLMLAPGERAEILIDLAPFAGQNFYLMNFGSEIPNGIYGAAQPGMGAGQTIVNYTSNPLNGNNFNILNIQVVSPTTNPIISIPISLVSHNPWQEADANITRTLTFTAVNQGPTSIRGPFVINGTPFNMMMINYEIPFNNIEIWELRNQSPIGHPFHIHNVNFYILDINGNPPPQHLRGKKDVIHVPAGNGVVRFITKFETFYNDTLPYMYHCHMLTHEDDGMMGQFVVKAPCLLAFTGNTGNASVAVGTTASFSITVNDSNINYQWQSDIGFGFQNLSNAGQYSGVNSSTLTVNNVSLANQSQIFRCYIYNNACSDTSEVFTIEIDDSNVNEILNTTHFTFFPNPANDQVFVKYDMNQHSQQLQIFNQFGQMVHTSTINNTASVIDINSLTSGFYLLKLSDSNHVYKLIKH